MLAFIIMYSSPHTYSAYNKIILITNILADSMDPITITMIN